MHFKKHIAIHQQHNPEVQFATGPELLIDQHSKSHNKMITTRYIYYPSNLLKRVALLGSLLVGSNLGLANSVTFHPLVNHKSGISVSLSGTNGTDWAIERTFHDEYLADQIIYMKSNVTISLAHNENNTFVNTYAPNRHIGINGQDGIPNSGDEGTIHYKIDRDQQAHIYADGTLPSWCPPYSSPFSFDSLIYANSTPVLGTVGHNGGNWGTEPSSTKERTYYGMLDKFGNEWHVLTYWDDDIAALEMNNIKKHRQGASDGHYVPICVNPVTPIIQFQAIGSEQYYTTPVKTYHIPKIWEQTTYLTAGVEINFINLSNASDVFYQVDTGDFIPFDGTPLIASDLFSGIDTTYTLTVKCGTDGPPLTRTIVYMPDVPAPEEVHGNLFWADDTELAAIRTKVRNVQPFKKSYDTFRGSYYQQSDTTYSNVRGGWRSGAGMASSSFSNAFVVAIEGPENELDLARLAKTRLLRMARLQPVGSEADANADTPGKDYLNELGQTIQQFADAGLGYDLLVAHFRSSDHPQGITPIEEYFIRDGIAEIATTILGRMRANYSANVGGGDTHWSHGFELALGIIALAMPTYKTSYYGVSGGDFISINDLTDSNGQYWNPYPDQAVTWYQAATDRLIPCPGHPGSRYPLRAEFLLTDDGWWTGPNEFQGDGDRYHNGVFRNSLVDIDSGGLANAECRIELVEMSGYESPFVDRLYAFTAMRSIKGDPTEVLSVNNYIRRRLVSGYTPLGWDANERIYTAREPRFESSLLAFNPHFDFAGLPVVKNNVQTYLHDLNIYYGYANGELSDGLRSQLDQSRKEFYSAYSLALCADPAAVPDQQNLPVLRPIIKPMMKHVVIPGERISKKIIATEMNGGPLTISVENLPTGASYDPTTRIIQWLPTSADEGVYIVNVNVTNSQYTTTRPFPIIVKADAGSGPIPNGPSNLTAELVANNTAISLQWDIPNQANIHRYFIYRDGAFIAAVSPENNSFIDSEYVAPESHTRYHISLITDNGAESYAAGSNPGYITVPAADTTPAYYVRSDASGTNDGSDWNNAYTALPATLERGATYYIADGNYSKPTFDEDESGTTLITIKKATQADHGTASGWDASYGDDQAVFSSRMFFGSGYWVIDGNTPVGVYGFKLVADEGALVPGQNKGKVVTMGKSNAPLADITIKGMELDGSALSGGVKGFDWAGSPRLFSNCRVYQMPSDAFASSGTNDFTIEYCHIDTVGNSLTAHADAIAVQAGNKGDIIIRHNIINWSGQMIWFDGQGDGTHNGATVYGNLFVNTVTNDPPSSNTGIKSKSSATVGSLYVYNNTFAGIHNAHTETGDAGSVFMNNLYYNIASNNVGFGSSTHSHNWFQAGLPHPTEANEQIGTDPFVDYSNGNFGLAQPTAAGQLLTGEYALTRFGNTRGADGNWDRGAFEFGENGSVFDRLAARAGIAQTVTGSEGDGAELVTLDASYSDGVIVSYVWQIEGSIVATGVNPTLSLGLGVHEVTLVVTDNLGATDSDTVTITIIADLPPVANAGADQAVYNGFVVTLDGAGSNDPNGDALAYTWTQTAGPTVSLSDANAANPTFTAPEDTTLSFTLTVTANGKSASDNVTITSTPAPPIPIDGLVHAWLFDEASGNTATNNINSAFNGTLNGVTRGLGQVGNALVFAGGDDERVDIPTFILSGDAFTLSLWMHLQSQGTTGDARLFSKATGTAGNAHDLMLSTIDSRALRFRLNTDASDNTVTLISPDDSFTFNTWHHVAVTYDGAALTIWVDGSAVANTDVSGNITQSTKAIALGNQPPGAGDKTMDGSLDQVRLYNRALSAAEIVALRNEANDPNANDTTAPNVAVTTPADNAVLSGSVAVTATASDNVAVQQVAFALNGNQMAVDSTAPYEYNWDTAQVTDGSYTMTAVATDTSGNVNTAAINVTVDNSSGTAPQSYREFQSNHGIGSPTNDDDNDQMPNLFEYFVGSDPTVTDAMDTVLWMESNAVNTTASFNFMSPIAGRADLVVEVQKSTDMVNWSTVATRNGSEPWPNNAGLVMTPMGDNMEQVQFEKTIANGERCFYRLKIQTIP